MKFQKRLNEADEINEKRGRERERRKKDENPGNDHRTGAAERNKEDQRRRQGVIATFR